MSVIVRGRSAIGAFGGVLRQIMAFAGSLSLILFVLIWPLPAEALQPVNVDASTQHLDLGPHLRFREIRPAESDLEKVLQSPGDWQPVPSSPPNFGFSESGYWFSVEVHNRADTAVDMLLQIAYPLLDQIEIHHVSEGNTLARASLGDRRPFAERLIPARHFLVPLVFAPGSTSTLYVYLQTTSSVQLPLTLHAPQAFYNDEMMHSVGLGLYYGAILIMAVYNLFLFVTVRDRTYLFYVFFVVSFLLFQLNLSGHAFQYLWPTGTAWGDASAAVLVLLTNLGGALFAIHFLGLRQNAPRAWMLCVFSALIATAGIVACLFISYSTMIRFAAALTIFDALTVLFIGILLWKRGMKHARYYVIAWCSFLIGCTLLSMALAGILPLVFITEHGAKIGSLLEVVMLSFALGDRINEERRSKLDTLRKIEQMKVEMVREIARKKEIEVAAESSIKAKDEFLSTMSHEIRTPLNGVVGVVQLLQQTSLDEHQHQLLRIMAGSAQTLLSIINDILDFSKIQAGKMHIEAIVFDLHALLDDLAGLYGMTLKLKEDVRFVLVRAPDVPRHVLGDPVRLRQILTNYLNNAVKFTTRGTITLKVTSGAEGQLVFDVEDTGIGIDPAGMERLFRAFSQTSDDTARKYGGTGLGLSICKRLSELMGGDVGARSSPGQGSVFSVRLPLPAEAPPRIEVSGDDAVADLSGLTVLVAEDNSVNQFVVKNLLRKLGVLQVVFAANGVEALTAVGQHRFDVILMDCQMPEMDGYEATRRIREQEAGRAARIPIAALTASASREEQQQCLDAGMDMHLAKPVVLDELRKALVALHTKKAPQ
jgi:signal transduction histidine kinase/CheY-like chemotaxis protein